MKEVILVLFAVGIIYLLFNQPEKYRMRQSDYRYGMIDTNPMRRTAGFFDNCSPENMADCSRNNPYEGLPLP